jgi:hypothetical protein
MKKPDLRAELRIPITHRGSLAVPGAWAPCLIENVSSIGFLIMCNGKFSVREVLELKCALYPERFLQCKVEIRHITDMCVGAKIVEINNDGLTLYRQFLDEHYILSRFG